MMYPFTRVAMPQRTPFTQGCRYLLSLLIAACFLVGCGKSPTPNVSPSLRLHWLGKKRLSAESNATNFISIWNLPESVRLENQTLDKLSTAPWRLLATSVTLSNAPTALLRPLLNDVVQEETYLEVLSGTNQPYEAVLAIKLPPDRAALWQANLPPILKSLSSNPSANPSLSLANIGNWTILSISDLRLQASKLSILPQIRQRLAATGIPFVQDTTNDWINGSVEVSWLSRAAGWQVQSNSNLPVVEFSAMAEAGNVKTLAKLTFPSNAPIQLQPWNIPTNMIFDPLIAFTASRHVAPLLDWWQNKLSVHALQPFDQVVSWAVAGFPFQTYFAIPQPQPTNAISLMSDWLTQKISGQGGSSFPGRLVTDTNFQRVTLEGFPFVSPRLEAVQDSARALLFGGFIPIMRTNRPMPFELLAQINADTNLFYYDWEITGPRVEAWTYIGQTMRLMLNRAQLPPGSLGMDWLKAVTPRAGNSVTAISVSASNRLSLIRNSTIGMTGVEAHLLVDWLESPEFPVGFHSDAAAPIRGLPPFPGKTK